MSFPLRGKCQKCQTDVTELFDYNGRKLCKVNFCYDEEIERDSGKAERDLEKLNEYRRLVAGTKI